MNGRLWNKELIGFLSSTNSIHDSFQGRKDARTWSKSSKFDIRSLLIASYFIEMIMMLLKS